MTYTMSRDYDKLYDLLCGGGEAFAKVLYTGGEVDAKWLRRPEPYKSMSGYVSMNYGGIHTDPNKDQRSQFAEHCTRLNLEWLPPVDIAEIIAAGERLAKYARHWHKHLHDDEKFHGAQISNYFFVYLYDG